MRDKKANAIAVINRIRGLPTEELQAVIVREAGEELSAFFVNYAATLIAMDPDRAAENTSALMLMGYLIRAEEELKRFFPASSTARN